MNKAHRPRQDLLAKWCLNGSKKQYLLQIEQLESQKRFNSKIPTYSLMKYQVAKYLQSHPLSVQKNSLTRLLAWWEAVLNLILLYGNALRLCFTKLLFYCSHPTQKLFLSSHKSTKDQPSTK